MKVIKIVFSYLLPMVLLASCKSNKEEPQAPENEIIKIENIQKRSLKRGVGYNFQIQSDVDLLSPGISWYYNWANSISESLNNLTKSKNIMFYPMTWDRSFNANNIREFKKNNPDCEYLLAYNEPNLTDQANMTPAFAAEKFEEVLNLARELNMKVISPAMNYGTLEGYHNPIKWLDEFFELVPKSNFAGISLHCYMASPSAVKGFVRLFKKYNLPIWLTEFCSWEDGLTTPSQQLSYAAEMVNYLETSNDIFNYAWFMPRMKGSITSFPYNQLLTKDQPYKLTGLGNVYINMSSFDKTTYYGKNKAFSAAHYSSLNMEEYADDNRWVSSVLVRPTSDKDGNLEIYQFLANQWVEYQIDVPSGGNYKLDLRRASYRDATLEISIGGKAIKTLNLERTGEDNIWKTETVDVSLTQGKQTIRLKVLSGYTSLNWLRFR